MIVPFWLLGFDPGGFIKNDCSLAAPAEPPNPFVFSDYCLIIGDVKFAPVRNLYLFSLSVPFSTIGIRNECFLTSYSQL